VHYRPLGHVAFESQPFRKNGVLVMKHRLQFDFSDEALDQLDQLKDAVGVATRADLIRHALRILQWTVLETRDNDATILLEKNGKLREVVFPFMTKSGETSGRKKIAEGSVAGQV
jgi:hypothetical protein